MVVLDKNELIRVLENQIESFKNSSLESLSYHYQTFLIDEKVVSIELKVSNSYIDVF